MNIYDNNREFERLLAEYTGAPHVVVLDNNCNGIFLCLRYFHYHGPYHNEVTVRSHTYPGVAYAVKAAGYKVRFGFSPPELKGEYKLEPFPLWDSALRFTSGMYKQGQFQVLSFTGPFKTMKLGKAGAILCPTEEAATWLRRAAFSGRNMVSYHDDVFDMPEGYNMYLPATIATLGVQLMQGVAPHNPDLTMTYPDLSDPKHTGLNT